MSPWDRGFEKCITLEISKNSLIQPFFDILWMIMQLYSIKSLISTKKDDFFFTKIGKYLAAENVSL